MAEKRMFAKAIIDSDAFLDMPLTTQALYFHLSMRADDDGFVNNPKKIQRVVGATDDDLKLLMAKSFIIPFESGIVVIKHWKIHNYIQKDRYKETVYQSEKSLLSINDDGTYVLDPGTTPLPLDAKTLRQRAYEESELPYSFDYKIRQAFVGKPCPVCGVTMNYVYNNLTAPTIQHNLPLSKGGKHELGNISVICRSCNTSIQDAETGELNAKDVIEVWDRISCTHSVSKTDTQISIDKNSIDKEYIYTPDFSAEKSAQEVPQTEKKSPNPMPNYQTFVDLYHQLCPSLPKIQKLTETRKTNIKARWLEYPDIETFKKVFEKCENNAFMKGNNDRGWIANIDFIIQASSFTKIVEGFYDNMGTPKGKNSIQGSSFEASDFYKAAVSRKAKQ